MIQSSPPYEGGVDAGSGTKNDASAKAVGGRGGF